MTRGGIDSSEIIVYGLLGYTLYYAGKNNYLGKQVYDWIHNITATGGGGGAGGNTPPVKPPVINPCDMIDNVQYVAWNTADNRWWVVVNGKIQYRVQSKDLAEAIYRWMCCGNAQPPGAPSEWT